MHRSGRLDEARIAYQKVLKRDTNHFDALQLLGALYLQAGQPDRALPHLTRAARINPRVGAVQGNLGSALLAGRRPEEALACFDAAVGLDPNSAEAHFNRGGALLALRNLDEALASFDRAISLNPGHVKAHVNRGVSLQRMRRPTEALASFDRAIALQPDNAEAWFNRGPTLHDLGRPEEALVTYDKAIAIRPNHLDALANRAATLLQLGNFERGWREYEWRLKKWKLTRREFDEDKRWLGKGEIEGKSLLLYDEQGLGDTIQFYRYARLLGKKNVDITISVQETLVELFRTSSPGVKIIGPHDRPPRFDYNCPLGSLPLALQGAVTSIPTWPAYLVADEARKARFAAALPPRRKPRVGVVWSGAAYHENDHNRSIAFERLAPLLVDRVDWFALQNEIRPSDAESFRDCGRVAFPGGQFKDFADTAAFLDLMDLVVTVDTSIAHLAGAMGKPVWIMLPFNPDWRWMLNRSDSPWYPSARLFRQHRLGDWTAVFREIDGVLSTLSP